MLAAPQPATHPHRPCDTPYLHTIWFYHRDHQSSPPPTTSRLGLPWLSTGVSKRRANEIERDGAGGGKKRKKNIKKIESYEGWPLQKRDRHDDKNGNDRNRRTPAADRSPFSARPPRRIRSPLGRTREGCQPAAGTGWILPLTVLSVHSTYICMYGLHLRARMGASSCGCNCFALL
jgi:hypothetical protein